MTEESVLEVDREKCVRCFGCVSVCPTGALAASDEGPKWTSEKCKHCNACVNFCPVGALKFVKKK